MLARCTLIAVAALAALLAPGSALASAKCQCNNGSIVNAMGADYDDEDIDEECNDACSMQGGGRVWSVDRDQDDDDDTNATRGRRPPIPPPPR